MFYVVGCRLSYNMPNGTGEGYLIYMRSLVSLNDELDKTIDELTILLKDGAIIQGPAIVKSDIKLSVKEKPNASPNDECEGGSDHLLGNEDEHSVKDEAKGYVDPVLNFMGQHFAKLDDRLKKLDKFQDHFTRFDDRLESLETKLVKSITEMENDLHVSLAKSERNVANSIATM